MKNDNTLRDNGLPFVVPLRRWSKDLLWRTTPVLLFLLLSSYSLLWFEKFLNPQQADGEYLYLPVGVIALLFVLIFGAVVGLYRFANTRPLIRHVIVVATIVGWIASTADDMRRGTVELISSVALFGIIFAICWLGVFSIARWTFITSLVQFKVLSHIAGKILPVSIFIIIFGFFSTEFWQITDKFSTRSTILFLLAMSGIALVTSLSVAHSELSHDKKLRAITHAKTSHIDKSLALLRKINIYFVIAATQLIQGLIFFVLLSLLLIVLNKIVLDPSVIAKWIEHAPVMIKLDNLQLPVSINELYAAMFCASLATLNMLVSAATDNEYRAHLFDPILDNIRSLIQKTN